MNTLFKNVLCSAVALMLAGTSVARTKHTFTSVDFSTIQSPNSNPFGLVYQGAITMNEPGKVNIHRISYDLNGLIIVANVYTPAGYDTAKTYPALVVAHPNGGCKEQVAGLYSQRMAEQGYICLAFDAAYQGGSEGEPRNVDKPANRIEDGDMSGISPEQAKQLPFDLYRDGYKYYLQTHAHPGSTFRYTKSSLVDLMAFDASEGMYLINQPLLMMAGSNADTFYMTEQCFSKATGTDNKELYLIPGARHIQTYWVPEHVEKAVGKLTEFFGKHLE